MPNQAPHPPRQRPTVPKEYGGKWIAWNANASRIIASGDSLKHCALSATAVGEANPQFENVPRPGVRIIGIAR
jgi:hypothetical protein